MKTLQTMACAIVLAVPPAAVLAQANLPGERTAGPAPSTLTYQSAFEHYEPYEDVPLADWRRVNDTVRDAAAKGGGKGHGSSTSPAPGTGKEAVPPSAPAGQGRNTGAPGGQHMHGAPESHGGQPTRGGRS